MEKADLTAVIPLHTLNESTAGLKGIIWEANKSGIQLIVVINSTDAVTRQEISAFITDINNPNLQILETGFDSPGEARNLGLNACSTQYVTFWDSDDMPIIRSTQNLLQQLSNHPEKKYGVGSFEIVQAHTEIVLSRHLASNEWTSKRKTIRTPGIWRWIFRTDAIKGVKFQSFSMGEDQDFLADLNPDINYAIISDEVTYRYVQGWKQQLTRNQNAIDEIILSISYLANKVFTNSANDWHARFLLRQLFTAIKRTTWRRKVQAFALFIKLLRYYAK